MDSSDTLSVKEIKMLWEKSKHLPLDSTFTYKTKQGREVVILVDWLKYAYEYVTHLQGDK